MCWVWLHRIAQQWSIPSKFSCPNERNWARLLGMGQGSWWESLQSLPLWPECMGMREEAKLVNTMDINRSKVFTFCHGDGGNKEGQLCSLGGDSAPHGPEGIFGSVLYFWKLKIKGYINEFQKFSLENFLFSPALWKLFFAALLTTGSLPGIILLVKWDFPGLW